MKKLITPLGLVLIIVAVVVLAGCGSQPAAQAPDVRYTYVANAADGTVSAIDLTTDQVAWTLPIGERAAHGIAASPDGTIVYAGDAAVNEVVVIDAERQVIMKRIPIAHGVHGIDISPDGQTLWVGGSLGDDALKGTLTAINTASNTIEDVISPGLGSASHFAFTPDGSEIWIASTSTNLIWIVDTTTRQVAATVPLSVPADAQRPAPADDWDAVLTENRLIGLNEVAISPDGSRAYAVGPATSELYAIDVKSRQVVTSVPAGDRAHGVTVSPDGTEVWIADWAGVVNVFDAERLEQQAHIQVADTAGTQERGANHVAFSRDGQRAYVSGVGDVTVIARDGLQVINRVAVGQEPHELTLEDWVAPDARIDTAAIRAAAQSVAVQPDTEAPAVGSDAPTSAASGDLTRVSDEQAVVVEVTPLNLTDGGPTLDFQVALNTHAVDLNYDLAQIAVLRDDRGNEYRPATWSGPQGGHHVSGVLSFDGYATIVTPETTSLELELQGIAQVPSRRFRWEMRG